MVASGAGVSVSDAKHAEEVVNNYKETQNTYYSGGKAFSVDPREWYDGLMADGSVVPIGAGLIVTPLSEILNLKYFPNDISIDSKKENLLLAVDSYCGFLGEAVCTTEPVDPEPVPPSPPAPKVSTMATYSLNGAGTFEKLLVNDDGKNICFIVAGEGLDEDSWCRIITKPDGYYYISGHSDETEYSCEARCATTLGKLSNPYSDDGQYLLDGENTEETAMVDVHNED